MVTRRAKSRQEWSFAGGQVNCRFLLWLRENAERAMIPLMISGGSMKRFVAGADRGQSSLLPECLDDWVDESNPVRVIDAFVDGLDLGELGFSGVEPSVTGRPSYHPCVLLKLYILRLSQPGAVEPPA